MVHCTVWYLSVTELRVRSQIFLATSKGVAFFIAEYFDFFVVIDQTAKCALNNCADLSKWSVNQAKFRSETLQIHWVGIS